MKSAKDLVYLLNETKNALPDDVKFSIEPGHNDGTLKLKFNFETDQVIASGRIRPSGQLRAGRTPAWRSPPAGSSAYR